MCQIFLRYSTIFVTMTLVRAQMLPLLLLLLLLLSAASLTHAAPAEHEIKVLPGLDGPLLSKTYAGFVDAGSEGPLHMYEHYMFVESEGNPATDPVLVWTNGGPGKLAWLDVGRRCDRVGGMIVSGSLD